MDRLSADSAYVLAPVNVDYLPGDKITPEQKQNGIADIDWIAMPLHRDDGRKVVKVPFILSRRRQNQSPGATAFTLTFGANSIAVGSP